MALELYHEYDRRGAHDVLDPGSAFVTGAGNWGIRGIIRIPESPGDFALFVTLGKQEGAHQFDESINDDGILRWQSQPAQTLQSPAIRELLRHDPNSNNVHLFLRTARLRGGVAPPFTYLGPLRYHDHDRERSKPAHIAWELTAWPIPKNVLDRMGLELVHEVDEPFMPEARNSLVEEPPPDALAPIGETTSSFKARKVRYQSSDQSKALGLAGELLVLERERAILTAAGRLDLAEAVMHTSVVEGDGAGYDIASFFTDGRPKFVEVKTTTGPKNSDFMISPNELNFSEVNADSFELCRVFAFVGSQATGRCYSLFGNMKERLSLIEAQYRARPVINTSPTLKGGSV